MTFNSDTLSKQIFKLPADKFKIDSYQEFSGMQTTLCVGLKALKTGPNKIGPFTFEFNGKIYKTDVIKVDFADSLPNVERGLWIRKVPVDDSTVYIIVDQRIPAHNEFTRKDSSITMSAKVNDDEKETKLSASDNIKNARIEDWGSSSETIPDFTGKGLSHASYYKCYKVTIIDKNKPLILTKAAFVEIPDYYKFQDIQIN